MSSWGAGQGSEFDVSSTHFENLVCFSVPLSRSLDLESIFDLVRDSSGMIVGARATSLSWFEKVDLDNLTDSHSSSGASGAPTSLSSLEVRLHSSLQLLF